MSRAKAVLSWQRNWSSNWASERAALCGTTTLIQRSTPCIWVGIGSASMRYRGTPCYFRAGPVRVPVFCKYAADVISQSPPSRTSARNTEDSAAWFFNEPVESENARGPGRDGPGHGQVHPGEGRG